MGLRNRALKLQQQAPYDMSVPLDHEVALTVTIPEGLQLVGKATAPLGAAYQDLLRRADRERWVDWADNVGKSPVPYSRDCYGYHPAVNMVWHGTLSDVTVLAHELGHALHTSFSQASQPYVYSSYTGLLAETAAIVNELLLVQYLVGTSSERALRRYLLTKAIDSFITNFFYASIATTFQLELHDMAERGVPLTYQSMTEVNTAIYHRFYGDTLEVTPQGIGSQWLRVPQHYFGFYSYQYVTGITAAAALTASILTESATAAPRYLTFLKAGSSLPPLEVLRTVGVDLENQTSTQLAVATFSNLVTKLENA
jgi:oligoendopeptidase F